MGVFDAEATDQADLHHHPGSLVECRRWATSSIFARRASRPHGSAEQQAAANRLLHGRSKAERTREAERNDKASRDLDRHRIETGDER